MARKTKENQEEPSKRLAPRKNSRKTQEDHRKSPEEHTKSTEGPSKGLQEPRRVRAGRPKKCAEALQKCPEEA